MIMVDKRPNSGHCEYIHSSYLSKLPHTIQMKHFSFFCLCQFEVVSIFENMGAIEVLLLVY